ncbi:MAG: pyruvate kinase [Candidatus Phaeomarinobacter sp.]
MRHRNVRVLATLGPASDDRETITRLYEAGADACRLNMSHSYHEGLARRVAILRELESSVDQPISILVDLQGPKLRVGDMGDDGATLENGKTFILDLDKTAGSSTRAPLPHPEIFEVAEPGHHLLLDDGKINLRVEENNGNSLATTIVAGGQLTSRKGVNIPDALLPIPALTAKDRSALEAALNLDVDWVALSFVQSAQDVAETKKLARGRAAVMAKVEKPSAIADIDAILDTSDGLMVARGDLGVECPVETVPGLQKRITRAARRAGKPVVIATQMLESMITNPVPTRAEVSDVATAVFEGADAVMLSAESAAGSYPVEAVAMMNSIAESIETDSNYEQIIDAQRTQPEPTGPDALSNAARTVAETLNASAIVCYTTSGSTGLRAARERSNMPVLALTPHAKTARRLSLVWGLNCVLTEDAKDLDDMVDRAGRIAFQKGLARVGDRIVIMAGVPLGTPGATNMLRVAFVADGAANH